MKKSAQTVIRPDACYTIAAANGRVLEVADFNTENGASVRLWSYEGQPWQQWFFVEAGENEYRIKNRFTGKVMDLALRRRERHLGTPVVGHVRRRPALANRGCRRRQGKTAQCAGR